MAAAGRHILFLIFLLFDRAGSDTAGCPFFWFVFFGQAKKMNNEEKIFANFKSGFINNSNFVSYSSPMLKTILLVGSGGFIGSVARYFVSKLNLSIQYYGIPLGTLLVNVSGSLLLGFLAGLTIRNVFLTQEWRLFLMVGICGGFTTFSTFTAENLQMVQNGQYANAFFYTISSLILGFAAVYLGFILSKLI